MPKATSETTLPNNELDKELS